MNIYENIKKEYIKFLEKNSKNRAVLTYITEMSFLKKLEELAIKENLQDELTFIIDKQKEVSAILKEKGIKQKDFISKMQVMGCDINPTSYSKLEGQVRSATDKEIFVISKILNMPMESLFNDPN